MTSLVRRPPAPPPVPADAGLAEAAKTVGFGPVALHTDWADLPISVPMPAETVWHVSRSETRRRGGACRQVVHAWALGASSLVRVEQSRPLAPTGDGRLAPGGKWAVVSVDATPVDGLVRLRYTGGAGTPGDAPRHPAGPTQASHVASVHEVLPAELRRLLGDNDPEVLSDVCWSDTNHEVLRVRSVGTERIVAARLARSNVAGQVSPWHVAVWRATPTTRTVEAQLPARRGLRSLLAGGELSASRSRRCVR